MKGKWIGTVSCIPQMLNGQEFVLNGSSHWMCCFLMKSFKTNKEKSVSVGVGEVASHVPSLPSLLRARFDLKNTFTRYQTFY